MRAEVLEVNLKLFSGAAYTQGFSVRRRIFGKWIQAQNFASQHRWREIVAACCWNLRREGFARLREMRCKIEFGNPLVEWARVQAPAVCNRRPALSKRHLARGAVMRPSALRPLMCRARPRSLRPTELHSAGKGCELFMQLARVSNRIFLMRAFYTLSFQLFRWRLL